MNRIDYHGPIVIDGQMHWGVPQRDQDASTIKMILDGRTRLIKGLSANSNVIEAYHIPGSEYLIHVRSTETLCAASLRKAIAD